MLRASSSSSSSSLLIRSSSSSCSLPSTSTSHSLLLAPSRRSFTPKPSFASRRPPPSYKTLSSRSSHPKEPPRERKWKHEQEITFSHGFVRKPFSPGQARQPPKQAPYGPGSGTASDPNMYGLVSTPKPDGQSTLPPPKSWPSIESPSPPSSSSSLRPSSFSPSSTSHNGFDDAQLPSKPADFSTGQASSSTSSVGPRNFEELPPSPFVSLHQIDRAFPIHGIAAEGGLGNASRAILRFQRGLREPVEDEEDSRPSLWAGEDDSEAAAWAEMDSLKNSEISVSREVFDPDALVSVADAQTNKAPAFFPSPQPYSDGFNFAPIPGDILPSVAVPANRIVANFDPLAWFNLPEQAEEPEQVPVPLVSPRIELPRTVVSEWRGDEESRIRGSRQGGGAWKGDEPVPLVHKKQKGEPAPTPTRLRPKEIPHPSAALDYSRPQPVESSSSGTLLPASADLNDPLGRYTEVSSENPSDSSLYPSSDPLLRPWRYTTPLLPSLTPAPTLVPSPIMFRGAPRHPSIVLPEWSLRKAAQLKQNAERNLDGSTHWKPTFKVSREKMREIRELAKSEPERWNLRTLSEAYGLDPEATRRILKSKWQEQDEWEWDADGNQVVGGKLAGRSVQEEDGLMAAIRADDAEGAFEQPESFGLAGEKRKTWKELSEEDPFGDIDEVDETGWRISGGQQFEAELEARELAFEREQAASPKSTATPGRRAKLLQKTKTVPFAKEREATKEREVLSAPPAPLQDDPASNTLISSSRRKHDARVSDPDAWIVPPSTITTLATPPQTTLLQQAFSTAINSSPTDRWAFEARANAAKRIIEQTRRVIAERRASKLATFAANPSSRPLLSAEFGGRSQEGGEMESAARKWLEKAEAEDREEEDGERDDLLRSSSWGEGMGKEPTVRVKPPLKSKPWDQRLQREGGAKAGGGGTWGRSTPKARVRKDPHSMFG